VKFVCRNEIFANTQFRAGELDCLLVNTTGELRFFYGNATVVFIGKSLTAIADKIRLSRARGQGDGFRTNMQNFAISSPFLKKSAAIQVNSPEALEKTIAELLADKTRRAELDAMLWKCGGKSRPIDRTWQ